MNNNMAEKNDDLNTESQKKTSDQQDIIVRKELDAAVNSLKKRIDNLKGVKVSFPKKPNPFRDDRSR
jgi:hypothetical protein